MKLTQTQLDILTEARAHRAASIVCGHQHGKAFGFRRSAAAIALRDAGLIELISIDSFCETRRGRAVLSGHESAWRLTDAGRAQLNAI